MNLTQILINWTYFSVVIILIWTITVNPLGYSEKQIEKADVIYTIIIGILALPVILLILIIYFLRNK
jgi:hypothetical protein